MFEGINLISYNESKKLFEKQNQLISKYCETGDEILFLRLALLQTMSPISDYSVAREILMQNIESGGADLLVIGAYISAEDYGCSDNNFLAYLLKKYHQLNERQKSITKYLHALEMYNKKLGSKQRILKALNESIELSSDYASNHYLRYIIMGNKNDLIKAKNNIKKIITEKEVSLLSIDELTSPKAFIDEHILMTSMVFSTFNSLFNLR